MKRHNNLYLMLLIFIMLTLAIIFCAAMLVMQEQSERWNNSRSSKQFVFVKSKKL